MYFAPQSSQFQFTPLREGRRNIRSAAVPGEDFNSRPSARGDDNPCILRRNPRNFNSRPSARGDLPRVPRRGGRDISIHAPPRGATLTVSAACSPFLFQFTPLREGRLDAKEENSGFFLTFQFTPLREGRLTVSVYDSPRGAISIHAPPRGATYPEHLHRAGRFDFNSRPSARGDKVAVHATIFFKVFQFTPLREGRRAIRRHCWQWKRFQFTPLREGRH